MQATFIERVLAPRYLPYPMSIEVQTASRDTTSGNSVGQVAVSAARSPARFLKQVLQALRQRNRSAVVTLFVK